MDGNWNDMLETLASAPAGAAGTFEEGGVVKAESWIVRASALALCARGHGAGSDAAMSGWVVLRSVTARHGIHMYIGKL